MRAVVISDADGRRWTLNTFPVLFGRDSSADVSLTDVLASRRHCEIVCTDDGLILRDLGSVNGTCVNGIRIDEHRLTPGDEITVGTRRFQVQRPGRGESTDTVRPTVLGGVAQMVRRLSGMRRPQVATVAVSDDGHMERFS